MSKYAFLLFFIFFSYTHLLCKSSNSKDFHVRDFYTEGTVDSNHLEKGLWKFYGLDKQELQQEGNFKNGLRNGKWHYYTPFANTIFWYPYRSSDSTIEFSIPDFLIKDVDEGSFIAFDHIDSTKLFILKVGVAKNENFDKGQYLDVTLNDVKKNSQKILNSTTIEANSTCGKTYYFSKFEGIDKAGTKYLLLTVNGFTNNLLTEVTIRCDITNSDFGEEVFFSVVSNLFVLKSRFFDEHIDCELINANSNRVKRSFSFGCKS